MQDALSYVPVIRWKRAERAALRELDATDKAVITPLIEIAPAEFGIADIQPVGKAGQAISTIVKQIAENWGQDPAFVDLGRLAASVRLQERAKVFPLFWNVASAYKVFGIPVASLSQSVEQQAAVRDAASARHRVCLRLTSRDIRRADLRTRLGGMLDFLKMGPEDIDIVVDYQMLALDSPSLSQVALWIPYIERWHTFVVVVGSFPQYLTGLSVGQHEIARHEWIRWRNELIDPGANLPRLPTFGDYTIQHPIFLEPPEGANVSASIRYTTDDYWVVMRGEGLRHKGSPGHVQYPANAELLCARKEFCGPHFSYGDAYIWEGGSHHNSNTGNPETWLRAGINHHITFAVRQIGSLLDSVVRR